MKGGAARQIGARLVRSLAPQVSRSVRTVTSIPARIVASAQLKGHTRLHLGCGPRILEGWANIDVDGGRGSIHLDLTQSLPVSDSSIECIYSEHFVEHLTQSQGRQLFAECSRVLAPGGAIRISTPDLSFLVKEYLAGNLGEWTDMDWSPASPCQLINEGMRLWGHQFLYDEPELSDTLKRAGFTSIQRRRWRESPYRALAELETRPYHQDLIVEAIR